MRNSSHFQRRHWWRFCNRFNFSSCSSSAQSTSCNNSSSSSCHGSHALSAPSAYIGSLASHNNSFLKRTFHSSAPHHSGIASPLPSETPHHCSAPASSFPESADSIQLIWNDDPGLGSSSTLFLDHHVDCHSSGLSTLVNTWLQSNYLDSTTTLLLRRFSCSPVSSLQFAYLPKRTYRNESVPQPSSPLSTTATSACVLAHGKRKRLRCSKQKRFRRRISQSVDGTTSGKPCVTETDERLMEERNSKSKKRRSSVKREALVTKKDRFRRHSKNSKKPVCSTSPFQREGKKKRNNQRETVVPAATPSTSEFVVGSGFSSNGSSFIKGNNEFKFPSSSGDHHPGSLASSRSPVTAHSMKGLKPSEIVDFLNQHIVGQLEAKKAVANALRNRWRRQQLRNAELRDDIAPKNILMIGPTGVGKTEIARRMAKILDAPFIKVEATKYTEVGFHGRDVDTIIKDLVEFAVRHQYVKLETEFYPQAQRVADERILQALTGQLTIEADVDMYENLRLGRFDSQLVSVEVPYPSSGMQSGGIGNGNGFNLFSELSDATSSSASSGGNHLGGTGMMGGGWRTASFNASALSSSRSRERTEKRTMSVKEARAALANAEFSKALGLITKARITQQALESVEQEGIVFLDEIDKICSTKSHAYSGPDASAEGVQRDLLPLIEGTTINTRYGNVKTDHILFIASGAFHSVKPSDMMAELQGRLPVRVELKPLTEDDFRMILTETRHNLIEQNIALLSTEGITLLFEPGAADEIARVAFQVNSYVENIGARRLVTIIEKIMEEISFVAPEMENGSLVRITAGVVRRAVAPMTENTDLHKFIL